MNIPILVLIFWLFLLFVGKSEGARGVSRHHSARQETAVNTISHFSAYREKLIRPCGYRSAGYLPAIGKRSAAPGRRLGLWNRISEISRKKDQRQNIFYRALGFLLSEIEADEVAERGRREVTAQNILNLELRNHINDVQFLITQHLLVAVSCNLVSS